MWQLSFHVEEEAKNWAKGPKTQRRILPENTVARSYSQILAATLKLRFLDILSWPKILESELLERRARDADRRCGSPYESIQRTRSKSNLLDALSLARAITKECRPYQNGERLGAKSWQVWTNVSTQRNQSKTFGRSCTVLTFWNVLHEGDEPRGRVLKEEKVKWL
jgi:hypothetical protein